MNYLIKFGLINYLFKVGGWPTLSNHIIKGEMFHQLALKVIRITSFPFFGSGWLVGCQLAGCRLLAVGCWLLAAGCSITANGTVLLVTSCIMSDRI